MRHPNPPRPPVGRGNRRSPVPFVLLVVLMALVVTSCADGPDGESSAPGDQPSPPRDVRTPPSGEATIQSISPRSGAPGDEVTIRASGLPAGAGVAVGLGPPSSEYEVIAQAGSDESGAVTASFVVPDWVERGRGYVVVVDAEGSGERATSDLFHVTTPEGTIRVEGRVTDEGVECTAMRTPLTGELYTLVGRTEGLNPGDRIVVEGTIAELSICQQGTTLEVRSIERK